VIKKNLLLCKVCRTISTYFLFLILIACFVFAESRNVYVEVPVGSSYMLGEKNITVAGITDPAGAFIVVDGDRKPILQGETKIIKGVTIFLDIVVEKKSFRNASVYMNITTPFDCGNGICEENESSFSCCYDCNCTVGGSCVDNQCIDESLNECLDVTECDDGNNCTADSCSGFPRECINEPITWCSPGDNCCPTDCTPTFDSDCPPPKECITDVDCLDSLACTEDLCDSSGECSHLAITACLSNDGCCPANCIDYGDEDCNVTEDIEVVKDNVITIDGKEIAVLNETEPEYSEDAKKNIRLSIIINSAVVFVIIVSTLYFIAKRKGYLG
jgi:hypothetical protein